MNWNDEVERYRQQLIGIVATLFDMIGLTEGGTVERLSWPLHRAVIAILRPAEAAVRRLIIAAARGLTVKAYVPRKAPAGLATSGKSGGRRSFQLSDPRQRHGTRSFSRSFRNLKPVAIPRVRVIEYDARIPMFWQSESPPPPPPPKPERKDTVSAAPLCRRLAAISYALHNLAAQARRYARLQARAVAKPNPRRDTILRRGSPPGLRRNSSHDVHTILSKCDWLARSVPKPDSS